MERQGLRLAAVPVPDSSGRTAALAIGGALLAAAAWATGAGADRARRSVVPEEIAEASLRAWLEGDVASAEGGRSRLREILDRNPFDTAARTVYASLLAETATTGPEREAAAREGRRAVAAGPNEERVRRAVVKIMARTGDQGSAVTAVRALFAESPQDAALVLSEIEPFLPAEAVASAIPESAGAWLARARRLRESGRIGESDLLLDALVARWPDDLAARRVAGGIAAGRGNAEALTRVVPVSLAIPEERGHAVLLAYRARSRALGGDREGARADAARAVALAPADPSVAAAAGDALASIDPDGARSYWIAALHRSRGEGPALRFRIGILSRIARLEEREGRTGDALRRWREVLDLDPAHPEARARAAAIFGGASPPGTPRR